MAEIIRAYREQMPAFRFISKRYGEEDRVNGSFAAKWGEWFSKGWFGELEKLSQGPAGDWDAYIGLCHMKEDGAFEYWIGMFLPPQTQVPEGYASQDFPAAELGVCWVQGTEGEIYQREAECIKRLEAEGISVGERWSMERYQCPRYTTPDEAGRVILDYCFFVR